MTNTRIEHDSMGPVEVPESALYAAQTQRAVNNFPVSGQRMPETFITALIKIKLAAAQANQQLGCISQDIGEAIQTACKALLEKDDLMNHFPVDIFQTGSGTSSNMNANEVIANTAKQLTGVEVHPNDHVNYGQSSNDVIPTCIHVSAALAVSEQLLPALLHAHQTIDGRLKELAKFCKNGRTHLMDAMPVRLDQSFSAWNAQIDNHVQLLTNMQPAIQSLALGGTAVGTGVNADPKLAEIFNQKLSEITGLKFTKSDNFFALISSQDTAVALSGQTKAIAVTLMKIANDLRWMNSGPLSGLAEIQLPELQPGSSIMPGKVNPVIPESAAMVAAQVMGNDMAIAVGGQSGNFELNVMLPLIGHNLLTSIGLLANGFKLISDKAISGFIVNEENLTASLFRNPILATALNPIIGYNKAAEIAKQAYKQNRSVIDVALELTDLDEEQLAEILNPIALTGE